MEVIMKEDNKASKQCYELFEKSGKVGYYMLYNALKDIEENE